MGILDDAIREHLELKRQSGAPDSELKQLEDEAFGPPTRPGEPDFPETGESPEQAGNGAGAETAVVEAPGAPETPIAPPPAEPDTGEAPGPETGEEPGPETGEEPSEAETAFYDHGAEPQPELELDEVDLGLEEEEPALEQGEARGETRDEREVPIESLETVEHPFPEELVDPAPADEEIPPAEPLPGEEPGVPGEEEPPPPGEEGDEQEEDDDVLADTPEFLKDAPEDDELWFEQREPKDFDF